MKAATITETPPFEALYVAHRDVIYRSLLCLVHVPELAEDLTQETFLRAFAARSRLANERNLQGWLSHIAVNLAYDTIRRQRLCTWLSFDGMDEAYSPDTDDFQETLCEQVLVAHTLSLLPEHYRIALYLCY